MKKILVFLLLFALGSPVNADVWVVGSVQDLKGNDAHQTGIFKSGRKYFVGATYGPRVFTMSSSSWQSYVKNIESAMQRVTELEPGRIKDVGSVNLSSDNPGNPRLSISASSDSILITSVKYGVVSSISIPNENFPELWVLMHKTRFALESLKESGAYNESIFVEIPFPSTLAGAPTKDAAEQEAEAEPSPALSVADELRKLKNLLDEGVLTPEEFEAQKKRLLK